MDEDLVKEQIQLQKLAAMQQGQLNRPEDNIRQYEQAIFQTLKPAQARNQDYQGAVSQSKSPYLGNILLPGQRSQYFGGPGDTALALASLQEELGRGIQNYSGIVKPVESLNAEDKANQKEYLDKEYNSQLLEIANEKDKRTAYNKAREIAIRYNEDKTNGYLAQHQGNVNAFRATLKDLNERFAKEKITADQKDKALAYAMRKYDMQGGVGKYAKDKLDAYGSYNPLTVANFQDEAKYVKDMTDGWRSSSKESGSPYWYSDGQWMRRGPTSEVEKVDYNEVKKAALSALKNNKQIVEYREQMSMLDADSIPQEQIDLQLQSIKAQNPNFQLAQKPEERKRQYEQLLTDQAFDIAASFGAEKQSFIKEKINPEALMFDQVARNRAQDAEEKRKAMLVDYVKSSASVVPSEKGVFADHLDEAKNIVKGTKQSINDTLSKMTAKGFTEQMSKVFNEDQGLQIKTVEDYSYIRKDPALYEDFKRQAIANGSTPADFEAMERMYATYEQQKATQEELQSRNNDIAKVAGINFDDAYKQYLSRVDTYGDSGNSRDGYKSKTLTRDEFEKHIVRGDVPYGQSNAVMSELVDKYKKGYQAVQADPSKIQSRNMVISGREGTEWKKMTDNVTRMMVDSDATMIETIGTEPKGIAALFGVNNKTQLKNIKTNTATETKNGNPIYVVQAEVFSEDGKTSKIETKKVTFEDNVSNNQLLGATDNLIETSYANPTYEESRGNMTYGLKIQGGMDLANGTEYGYNNQPLNKEVLYKSKSGNDLYVKKVKDPFGGYKFETRYAKGKGVRKLQNAQDISVQQGMLVYGQRKGIPVTDLENTINFK